MENDFGLILSIYFAVLIILLVPIYIVRALPQGKLFVRAGEAEWKAWVPFVSAYIRTKIVFGEDRAWWFLIDFILGGLFHLYVSFNEARAYGRNPVFAIFHMLFEPITTWIMWLTKDAYCGKQPFILD